MVVEEEAVKPLQENNVMHFPVLFPLHLHALFIFVLSSSSCSGSVALHLPWLSLIADHHSHFPQFLSSDLLPYLHCLFLSNQRSLLLNCRPQTIDIHEAGHSGTAPFICTVSKGTKATSHTMEPFPHVLGVREDQFP